MGRKVVGCTAPENTERYIHIGCTHGVHNGVYCSIPAGGKNAVRADLTEKMSEMILPSPAGTIRTEHNPATLEHINERIEFPLKKRMTRYGVVDHP